MKSFEERMLAAQSELASRRSIAVSAAVYARLNTHAERHGLSIADVVDALAVEIGRVT